MHVLFCFGFQNGGKIGDALQETKKNREKRKSEIFLTDFLIILMKVRNQRGETFFEIPYFGRISKISFLLIWRGVWTILDFKEINLHTKHHQILAKLLIILTFNCKKQLKREPKKWRKKCIFSQFLHKFELSISPC